MQVIPSLPPEEPEVLERIKKLVAYVARNGEQFEVKVREKEANNPHFSFLTDATSEQHHYYKWMLFIAVHHYTEDQVRQMESKHNHKIEWRTPGSLDLTPADEQQFRSQLLANNGSKDAIKSIRKWVLDRAHSMIKIGRVFRNYSNDLTRLPNSYSQLLHAAYVVNDLFYNCKGARILGPYTRLLTSDIPIDLVNALLPNISLLLRDCFRVAVDEQQQDKVTRLIELWTAKGFVTEAQGNNLRAALISETVPVDVDSAELTSPYLENPPPSNAPVLAVEEPIQPAHTLPMNGTVPGSNIPEAQLAQLQAIQKKIQQQLQEQQIQQQHMQQVENLVQLQQQANHNPSYAPVYPPFMGAAPAFPAVGGFHSQAPYVQPAGFSVPFPPQSAPFLDLTKIPVGNMANIVRAAKRAGHAPHTTLDVMMYASHATPHVEPGRVEVRIADFYKHADLLLNPSLPPAPADNSAGDNHLRGSETDKFPVSRTSHAVRHANAEKDKEESWVKYVPGYEDGQERSGQEQDWHRYARKGPRHGHDSRPQTAAAAAAETEIAEDNVGHKLLRGLGWQQGLGLGATSTGIVEPISAKPTSDRGGIGMASANDDQLQSLQDGVVDYSAYRKQRSTTYHSRISDRDTR